MEAQAWTAIGLLAATLIGTLVYLGTRIDGLGTRIDGLAARVEAQGAGLDARIDELAARLDARIDRLAEEVHGLALVLGDHLQRHAG